MTDRRIRRVGVFIESTISGGQALLHGIHAYVQERRPEWRLSLAIRLEPASVAEVFHNCDGIILAAPAARPMADAMEALNWRGRKIACVNLSAPGGGHQPAVKLDLEAVGAMGAEHLIERGFRRLAFYQSRFDPVDALDMRGFRRRAREAGLECIVFRPHIPPGAPEETAWRRLPGQMRLWLRRLPRPVAIMASNDSLGRQIVETCRDLGIGVPVPVAVLGVNNDERHCECGAPTLSSVRPDHHRIGHEAAALLDRLMGEGAKSVQESDPILIPPTHVVLRQSTDTFSMEDAWISKAMDYIREHACDPISVGQVLDHVGGCRRALERRFRQVTGKCPHQTIQFVRLEKAKKLLLETNLAQAEVADAAGFYDASALRKAFRQATGVSLATFRRGAKSGDDSFLSGPRAVR